MFYTYLIGWSEQNKWYYGVRVANKSEPEFDLWIHYFTSSIHVENYRKQFGEPDIVEIRKKFDDANKAILYEQKVLRRLKITDDDKWLNKHIGGDKFILSRKGSPLTDKHKKNISKSQLGKLNHQFGRPVTKQTREKISKALIGIKRTEQQIQKLKENHASRKPNYIPPTLNKKFSDETKNKIKEKATGRKHTEETKRKLSEFRLNNFRSTIHSEETKKLISEKKKEYWKKKRGL